MLVKTIPNPHIIHLQRNILTIQRIPIRISRPIPTNRHIQQQKVALMRNTRPHLLVAHIRPRDCMDLLPV